MPAESPRLILFSRITLAKKGLILLALPIALQVGFTGWLWLLNIEAKNDSLRSFEAKNIDDSVNAVIDDIQKLVSILYVAIDKNTDFRTPLIIAVADLNRDFKQLEGLVSGDAIDSQIVGNLKLRRQEVDNIADEVSQNISKYLHDDQERASAKERLEKLFKDFQTLAEIGRRKSELIEKSPLNQAQTRKALKDVVLAGTIFNAILFIFLAIFFRRHIINRLELIIDNSRRLSVGKPLNEVLPGADEISQLDQVFHTMAQSLLDAGLKERAIIEHSSNPIFSLNDEGRFVAVNRAMEALSGWTPDELIGKKLLDCIIDADKLLAENALALIMEGGKGEPFEARFRRKDGGIVELFWSAVWSKEAASVFCIAHDITERKQAERLQREVVQMVSHDLRSPLTNIRMIIDMFKAGAGGELEPEAQDLLVIADRNAALMLTLLKDILDIEKLDAGMLTLNKSTIPLAEAFAQAVQNVVVVAASKNVKIEIQETETAVWADRDRLVQILVNLLNNAVKFSPENSTVRLMAEDHRDTVTIEVKDHGPGIPAHMLNSIFERFQQLQFDGVTQSEGKGLGLTICKALVELHGGEIHVASEVGAGTSFVVQLPGPETNTVFGVNHITRTETIFQD